MKIFRVLQFSSIFCSWQFFLLLVQIILTSSVTNVSNFEYAKKLVQNEWYTHSRTCVLHSVVLTFKLCLVQNTCISMFILSSNKDLFDIYTNSWICNLEEKSLYVRILSTKRGQSFSQALIGFYFHYRVKIFKKSV